MTRCTNILLSLHLYDPVISIMVTLTIIVSWKNLNICDTNINRAVTEKYSLYKQPLLQVKHNYVCHCNEM